MLLNRCSEPHNMALFQQKFRPQAGIDRRSIGLLGPYVKSKQETKVIGGNSTCWRDNLITKPRH